jgi:transcriptional regulator with XRE-family HTH domain
MESFADRVKGARKSAGLTQKQLAGISGLSQTTISDIERGRNETSADVVALARALGVLAEWLADGKGPRTLSEATGQPPAPTHTVRESVSHDLEQMSVEARAKILAEQANEVSALWMALPAEHREAVLRQLRAGGATHSGDGRTLRQLRRKGPEAVTPDTKAHPEAD